MFKIVDTPETFSEEAIAYVPGPVPGERSEQRFVLTFELVGPEEMDEIQRQALAESTNLDLVEVAVLRRLIRGWKDVVADDKGTPLPFLPETLDAGLKRPWFRRAALAAWRKGISEDRITGN